MTEEEKVALAKEQLLSKYAELGRIPQKKDFDEATRSRIKVFLGPWPRALEKAGFKGTAGTEISHLCCVERTT